MSFAKRLDLRWPWAENPLNQSGEFFKSLPLFICIGMPVISSFNAGNDVPKHPFRNIRAHAGARHQGLGCSPQVMEGPVGNRLNLRTFLRLLLHGRKHRLVESSLALAESRKWRLGTRRKYVIA